MINFVIILFIISLIYLAKVEMVKSYFPLMGAQGVLLFALASLELHETNVLQLLFILLETLYQDPSLHHLIIERIIHSKSKQARQLRHDLVYRTCDELAAVVGEGVATGEFRSVDHRHLFLATVGACSFPMAERALFAELMGGPTTQAQLRAYAEFVSDVFLDGLTKAPLRRKAKAVSARSVF